jgi:hypothetical protein
VTKKDACWSAACARPKQTDPRPVELQRDALLAAGVAAAHLYNDHASGRSDDRQGLASCLKALRDGDTWSCGNSTASAATCTTWSTPSTT